MMRKLLPVVAGIFLAAIALTLTTRYAVTAFAQAPPTGVLVQTTVTCANTSTAVLTAQSATKFLLIQNSGAASVGLNFAGAAATMAAPSVILAAGQSITWSPAQGFVPASAINCIVASGTQAISVLYW